jgi:ribonuclease-3
VEKKAAGKKKNVIRRLFKFWFRHKSGNGLETKLGYSFKDPSLLAHALVHRSWLAGKDMPYWENNERLEFLGDSILNMLVTEYLYKSCPQLPEGDLSKRKSAIVSGQALAKTAQEWNLGEYIRIGKGEVKAGGRSKESLLADAFEAIVGAVYLDSGLQACRALLNKSHFPHIDAIVCGTEFTNYKSLLLEYMQGKSLPPPEYVLAEESGPEHHKVFEMIVLLEGVPQGRGKGVSKKKAEQEAARVALEQLNKGTVRE